MVGVRRLALLGLLTAVSSAIAVPLPAYKAGDIAETDIVTPVPLIVLDHAATDALKQREPKPNPLIVRFSIGGAAEVENRFLTAVSALRSNFLSAMHEAYPVTKVTYRNLPSKRFLQLTNSFQKMNEGFPLSGELVRVWALGGDDDVWFRSLADKLRATMERPLLPDRLPADVKAGDRVQLVYETASATAAPNEFAGAGWQASPGSLVTLGRARQDFVKAFPEEIRPLAAFAATFLRENCVVEAAPPQPASALRTEALVVANRYEAGEAVVKRGQVIDARALAALAQLREKTAVGELQQQVATAQTVAKLVGRQNWWLLAGVISLATALAVIVFRLTRGHPAVALVPMRAAERERLLLVPEGELPAPLKPGPEPEALRRGLTAQLARLLGTRLVQTLLFQRSNLLTTQRQAAREISELEQRLAQVHAPLRERLQAYEQRIAELEKELARKGAENRALIKAKIDLTRRQLKTERTRNGVELN